MRWFSLRSLGTSNSSDGPPGISRRPGSGNARAARTGQRRTAAGLPFLIAAIGVLSSGAHAVATPVTWFGPSQSSNSNATWSGTTSGQNYGVVFITGSSSTYSMDWMTIGLNTSTSGTSSSKSLHVELWDTNNLTPYAALPGTTLYASDTISIPSPTTANTNFTVTLAPADFPNISSFVMSGTTGYALKLWGPSPDTFGIQRTTGYANGTTNNFYTVSDGFVALDTFRNGIANYSNNSSSYPTLSIAFGTTAVPEPGTCTMALAGLACGGYLVRRCRKRA